MKRTSLSLRLLPGSCGAAIVGSILGAAMPAAADVVVVHPTGSYPADVQNVQAAVGRGGIVHLKAVNEAGEPTPFDFGPPVAGSGSVTLTVDVEIRGETLAGSMTTIRGGNFPFYSESPIRSIIERINFDRPRGAAVLLLASSGARITHNVMTGVVGFPYFQGNRKAQGIWILGEPNGRGPVTGTITIAYNTIADIDAENGLGLALVDFEADIKIIGNDIRGTNFNGILAFAHSGRLWITGNTIIPGPERFPGLYSAGNGIMLGPLYSYRERPTGPAHIMNNRILCENPLADGILIIGREKPFEGSVIAGNAVALTDSLFGGISLFENVSHTLVAGNEIRGSGVWALDVMGDTPGVNQMNVFAGNQVTGFHATSSHVFLDQSTANSLVVGCHGSVVDEGTDNRVVGCDRAPEAAAEQRRVVAPRQRRPLDVLMMFDELAGVE
jgi:hypothetical protein